MLIYDSKYGKAYQGDCLDIMKTLPDNSIETVTTDPPAGIGFMGKEWDKNKGGKANWVEWCRVRFQEALRLTKPGGLAAVWALPKTSNWTLDAVEDAGWNIKTKVYFLFGGGFPKALDISKAMDSAAGVIRENIEDDSGRSSKYRNTKGIFWDNNCGRGEKFFIQPVPITETAAAWNGWKTELKPMCEEWIIAEKPIDTIHWNELHKLTGKDYWHEVIELREGKQRRKFKELDTVPANARVILIKHKPLVPGLKFFDSIIVDGKPAIITNQRDFKPWKVRSYVANALKWGVAGFNIDECRIKTDESLHGGSRKIGNDFIYGSINPSTEYEQHTKGRYPGMVTIDQYIAEEMDRKIGYLSGHNSKNSAIRKTSIFGGSGFSIREARELPSGGPSRYFNRIYYYYGSKAGNDKHEGIDKNIHPTVKSLEFMQYLCRLTKPPSPGTVLDIFGGTFTTALAAYRENRKFIIIEQDQEFCEIGLARLKAAMEQKKFDF